MPSYSLIWLYASAVPLIVTMSLEVADRSVIPTAEAGALPAGGVGAPIVPSPFRLGVGVGDVGVVALEAPICPSPLRFWRKLGPEYLTATVPPDTEPVRALTWET